MKAKTMNRKAARPSPNVKKPDVTEPAVKKIPKQVVGYVVMNLSSGQYVSESFRFLDVNSISAFMKHQDVEDWAKAFNEGWRLVKLKGFIQAV